MRGWVVTGSNNSYNLFHLQRTFPGKGERKKKKEKKKTFGKKATGEVTGGTGAARERRREWMKPGGGWWGSGVGVGGGGRQKEAKVTGKKATVSPQNLFSPTDGGPLTSGSP